MHRVTHLVETVFPRLNEIPVGIERILLQEESDLVAGINEVTVIELLLVRRGKHASHLARIEGLDEFRRPRTQGIAFFHGYEVAQHEHTGRLEAGNHIVRQATAGGRGVRGYGDALSGARGHDAAPVYIISGNEPTRYSTILAAFGPGTSRSGNNILTFPGEKQ